jgi:plasmid stabilization system protein ParE
MTYKVVLTQEAERDLERLFDFVLERELAREGGDLELAQEARVAISSGLKTLERFPFTCRKAGPGAFLRELVVPFGNTGYVALFEIVDNKNVVVAAVRHQREDDYH